MEKGGGEIEKDSEDEKTNVTPKGIYLQVLYSDRIHFQNFADLRW